MGEVLPTIKRERWWVINEGVLADILMAVQGGKSWESAFVDLLIDAEVEYQEGTDT